MWRNSAHAHVINDSLQTQKPTHKTKPKKSDEQSQFRAARNEFTHTLLRKSKSKHSSIILSHPGIPYLKITQNRWEDSGGRETKYTIIGVIPTNEEF